MITGLTMFVWMIKEIFKGDLQKILARVQHLKITAIFLKVADGPGKYNLRPDDPENPKQWFDDLVEPFVKALQSAGVAVWGWGYIYGVNPEGEAERAAERVKTLNLAGWVIDAEMEYKNHPAWAMRYMARLRQLLPDTKIGLSSYRFPDLHPEFPWSEFMNRVDFYMPQVYWQSSRLPAAQLTICVREYRDLEKKLGLPEKPIYPIGAAYHENGWQPTGAEMQEFFQKVIEMGLQAASWWEWGCAFRAIPELESEFEKMIWPGAVIPPIVDPIVIPVPLTLEDRLTILESQVAELRRGRS